MNTNNLERLLNAELDDELSPEQLKTLEQLSGDSEEIRTARTDYQYLDNLLKEAPTLELPDNFHVPIQRQRSSKKNIFLLLSDWLLDYKVPLAMTSILVIFLTVNLQDFTNKSNNVESLLGSMVKGTTPNTLHTIGNETFNLSSVKVRVILERRENLYILTFDANFNQPVTLRVDYRGNNLNLKGFAPNDNTITQLLLENDALEISFSGSDNLVIIMQSMDTGLSENPEKGADIKLNYSIITGNNEYQGLFTAQ